MMMKIDFLVILFAALCIAHAIINGKDQNIIHFRGTMINPHLKEEDFRVLGNWKANHICWQLKWETNGHEADNATISQYEA
jgi:hypothetical protein